MVHAIAIIHFLNYICSKMDTYGLKLRIEGVSLLDFLVDMSSQMQMMAQAHPATIEVLPLAPDLLALESLTGGGALATGMTKGPYILMDRAHIGQVS